jgi:hypothetical protein
MGARIIDPIIGGFITFLYPRGDQVYTPLAAPPPYVLEGDALLEPPLAGRVATTPDLDLTVIPHNRKV